MTSSLVLFIAVALLVTFLVRHLRKQTRVERNARTETERQFRQADRLQQITAALSRARTSAEVISTCLPELLHATEAAAGAVFVADEGIGFELAHAVGYANPPSASKAALQDAIRSRDVALHEREVVIPLIADRPIGAVVLNLPGAKRVDDDEREFLLSAGRHMARALDRARLYEWANRARAEAEALRALADGELRERQKAEAALRLSEARYRTLAARTNRLYALSAGLSEAVTLDAVAKVTVRHGKVVAGASASSVALLVEGGTQFETLGGEEPDAFAIDSPRVFPAEPGLCATAAVETRRPIFVGSFAEWQERYPRSASIAADGGYASAATLPLVADGAVFAVLSFHFTAPVNFDEEYTVLLTSVAQHCAQALDRARSYETAERARADAEAANRSKDDFLSTISHELRTPLNAMLGWAAMLRSGAVDASRTQRAIEAIFTNATRQGRLIEELLDVSRIVAGRASFDLQNVDLGENIRGAVEAMMPLAAAKGVDVRFGPTPPAYVVADPRRLEQVFLNLFSNAVKFTPSGGHIAVDVTVSDRSVQIAVTDTGAGIAPAFLPHVFERFRQADSATTRNAGGLGLGLFIARQLVEAQGGAIRVASEGTGRGATFTVTLPVAATAVATSTAAATVAADPAPAEPMPVLKGLRVLLVDDEPDAREVMASALEICGATVLSAASARAALDVLATRQVDLLLGRHCHAGAGRVRTDS